MDESDERIFEMSPTDRKGVLGLYIYAPIALVGFLGYGLYRILSRGSIAEEASNLAVFSICILLLAIYVIRPLLQAKRMDWFRGRIRVTNTQITWESPSIHPVTARWSDLCYVKRNSLYFGEETALPLEFGPSKYGELKKEALSEIIGLSGPHPMLQGAYAARNDAQSPPRREKIIHGAAAVIGLAAAAIFTKWGLQADLSRAILFNGMVLIFWIGVLPTAITRFKREWAIARKFHPPRNARSRYKFPWS